MQSPRRHRNKKKVRPVLRVVIDHGYGEPPPTQLANIGAADPPVRSLTAPRSFSSGHTRAIRPGVHRRVSRLEMPAAIRFRLIRSRALRFPPYGSLNLDGSRASG